LILRQRAASLLIPLVLLGFAGCFRLTGPEDASPISPPALVSVTIEYIQPPGCLGGGHCNDLVVFYGSWMKAGTEFFLVNDPGNGVWRGVAYGVPVNWPPREPPVPYTVKIYDPHLLNSPTRGFTGDRMTVGSEALPDFNVVSPGRPDVHNLVYIDSDGLGHNAY
jgi:hypothetical protein